MKAAYADGCDYLYQSNDDVSFVSSGWATHFVDALRASPLRANYGVVGGLDLNNHLVLTQSLVHRTHQTMFGSHLAPTTINNWHLDDWMSTLYGPRATSHLKHVHMRNTNKFGTRYSECRIGRTRNGCARRWRGDSGGLPAGGPSKQVGEASW